VIDQEKKKTRGKWEDEAKRLGMGRRLSEKSEHDPNSCGLRSVWAETDLEREPNASCEKIILVLGGQPRQTDGGFGHRRAL